MHSESDTTISFGNLSTAVEPLKFELLLNNCYDIAVIEKMKYLCFFTRQYLLKSFDALTTNGSMVLAITAPR